MNFATFLQLKRVDVENPNPGERAGQVHYHDEKNTKYVYDFEKNVFKYDGSDELAPSRVQKKLKNDSIRAALDKGDHHLGEN